MSDNVELYIVAKNALKELRSDLKDIRDSLEEQIELNKLMKKVAELREKIKENETIKEMSEKIVTTEERLDMLKEFIRIEMLDKAQDEITVNDRLLQLKSIIRDIKNKKHTYHPDQLGFDGKTQGEKLVSSVKKFHDSMYKMVNKSNSGVDKVSMSIINPDGTESDEVTIAEKHT